MDLDNPSTSLDNNPIMNQSEDVEEEEVKSNNYGTWIAGGAIVLSLLGSLVSFNTAQTTLTNKVEALTAEIKKSHKDAITYVDKEIFIVDDRISRLEATIEKKNEDVENRLRETTENLHNTDVRAEKNETLLELLTDGRLP